MDDQPTIVLHLPIPPSLNKLWSHPPGRKRTRSPEYRKWLVTAGWEARRQLVGVPMIRGRFNVLIVVPESSRRDRDAWFKPLLDLCEHVGAVKNDGGQQDIVATASDRTDCMVALWDIGGPEMPEPRRTYRTSYVPPKRPSPDRIASAERARRLP